MKRGWGLLLLDGCWCWGWLKGRVQGDLVYLFGAWWRRIPFYTGEMEHEVEREAKTETPLSNEIAN
jgi:hypothetical protein